MSKDPLFEADDAATPLTPEEKLGLMPNYISLRRELNEAEQINVTRAEQTAFARKRAVLDERYLRRLHQQMFRDVWTWAGEFRTSERNIGVEPWRIAVELHELLENVRNWIAHQTYPIDEIATRFHHKLVWIHCFANGNGRHGRRRGHPPGLRGGAAGGGQSRRPAVVGVCAVVAVSTVRSLAVSARASVISCRGGRCVPRCSHVQFFDGTYGFVVSLAVMILSWLQSLRD